MPFETPVAKAKVVEGIVERVAELGFTEITIGGGDPFQYSFIGSILVKAKAVGLFVHVDTHGKLIRESNEMLTLISDNVDLIGLPLDGPTAVIHDDMRSQSGHFDIILHRIGWLAQLRSRLKINTVISAVNVDTVTDIAILVKNILPSRWSIYQYWPLGPAKLVANKHTIKDDKFEVNVRSVAEGFRTCRTVVEVNAQEDRRDTYPLIHHDGSMYVHELLPQNDFRCIGSVFAPDALEKILSACGPDRPATATRYRKELNE